MSVLFIFILSIISVSFVRSDPPQSVICAYGGANGLGTFVLQDVPPRCKAILYGGNYFEVKPPDADTAAITELKNCGNTVYMLYMYSCNADWKTIVSDPTGLEGYIKPMVTYLTENKIDGVFLAYLELHDGKIPDYSNKIKTLIDIIKKCVPAIKVGLWIDGQYANRFVEKNLFQFSVTNSVVDIYIVDTACAGVGCLADTTAKGGRLPLRTIKNICGLTLASEMDKSKVVVNLIDITSIDEGPTRDGLSTYSAYCTRNDSKTWCVDSTEILYSQVKEFQKVFKGLVISYLDSDDFKADCQCDKFPIANTYIDAWENKTLKCCDKIDKV